MEILHFQTFIKSTEQVAEKINLMKQQIKTTKDGKVIQKNIFSNKMLNLLESYKKICARRCQWPPWKKCQVLDDICQNDAFVPSAHLMCTKNKYRPFRGMPLKNNLLFLWIKPT